jgi:hypothetical protein
MNTITFDIETIPQQAPLTKVQEEELDKKIKRQITEKTTKEEFDGIRNKTMATSPFFGEIACIGIMKVTSNNEYDTIAITGTEEQILKKWWQIISKHRGLFVHFNGLGFDVPFIVKRSLKHKILPTNQSFLDTRRFLKYPHFDVYQILGDFDRWNSASLNLASDWLGFETPKGGEVVASNVYDAYKKGEIDKIAEYCLKDVETTFKIYNMLKAYTHNPKGNNYK